jgi:hypothetical protein
VHVPGVRPIGPIPPPPLALDETPTKERIVLDEIAYEIGSGKVELKRALRAVAEFPERHPVKPSLWARIWRRIVAWLNADSKKPFVKGERDG